METKTKIAKAILGVMKDVSGIEKNTTIGSGNYAYQGVKDQDVKKAFQEAFLKHKLSIVPIGIDAETRVDRWVDNNRQKQSVFVEVNTKYLLLHESGESIELAGYGHGVDAQDKASGKATTYALKNALLYTFLTPVGEIDDTDAHHSEEMETPQKTSEKIVSRSLKQKEVKNWDGIILKGNIVDIDGEKIKPPKAQIEKLKTLPNYKS